MRQTDSDKSQEPADGRPNGQCPATPSAPAAADTPSRLRSLPSVDEARRALAARLDLAGVPAPSNSAMVDAVRAAIEQSRQAILAGERAPTHDETVTGAMKLLQDQARPLLRQVINAGGAILNTNLGRAPLSARAIQRISAIAAGYSNLELDLDSGDRGSRQSHVRDLLRSLTSAEDALVVNNNAAATLVTLAALAAGREVIVSRGELVEIGGGFRVPDILAQSGARLVEVGTTNRVRIGDYASAIHAETALILSVHPSNFRIVGFTESPSISELATLAHSRDLPLARDLGSGALLDTARWGLAHEDSVIDCVRAGVDVTCFSGDKLLGGPQAGVIAGKSALLERIERHPLMRAVRSDKLTLAALEATLQSYRDGSAISDLPLWRAISYSLDEIKTRARRWARELEGSAINATVVAGETTIGGGSLPGETLPTALCAISAHDAGAEVDLDEFARQLRLGDTAVIARIARDQVLFDPRTVLPDQDNALLEAIVRAWSSRHTRISG